LNTTRRPGARCAGQRRVGQRSLVVRLLVNVNSQPHVGQRLSQVACHGAIGADVRPNGDARVALAAIGDLQLVNFGHGTLMFLLMEGEIGRRESFVRIVPRARESETRAGCP
jgi:hypothetical protein